MTRSGNQSLEWSEYEESLLYIRQTLTQLTQVGKNCSEDLAGPNGDEFLDMRSATDLIEDCSMRITQTQDKVDEFRRGLNLRSQEGKMLEEEWESIDREKRESIHISSHIDGELFPVINPDNVHQPDIVFRRLEEKISVSFQQAFY